jgi:hypothetical protein
MSLKKFDKMSQDAGEKRKPGRPRGPATKERPLPPLPRKRGRPSRYTPEIGLDIFKWIAEGNPLTVWCRKPSNPSYPVVMGWIVKYSDFAMLYAQAREISAHHNVDTIAEMVEEVRSGKIPSDAARVAIDAYKWAAGKRLPKQYGDRVAAPEPGKVDLAAMSAADLRALIEAARGELATIAAPSPALPAPDSARPAATPGGTDS